MEPVERQDAAKVGVDKEEARIVGGIRHREDAAAIAVEKIRGAETARHGGIFAGCA